MSELKLRSSRVTGTDQSTYSKNFPIFVSLWGKVFPIASRRLWEVTERYVGVVEDAQHPDGIDLYFESFGASSWTFISGSTNFKTR